MQYFEADARDGGNYGACNTCCCDPANGRPGEKNLWLVNFAPWAAGIAQRGLGSTSFTVEKIGDCPAAAGSTPAPTNTDYEFSVISPNPFSGNVSDNASGSGLTYNHLPIHGPYHGVLEFNADGTYTYTPQGGFYGYDEFYFQTTDGQNNPIVNKVCIAVNTATMTLPAQAVIPLVHIPGNRVEKDNRALTLKFPVEISPAAIPGEIYRVTLKQDAITCDGDCLTHISCYDLTIGKC